MPSRHAGGVQVPASVGTTVSLPTYHELDWVNKLFDVKSLPMYNLRFPGFWPWVSINI